MKKNLLKFSFVLGLAGILTGCDLESLDLTGGGGEFKTVDNAKVIVEENADTELAVVKVFENVNNYGISEEGKKGASMVDSAGPATSWDWAAKTMTMDFTGVDNASGKVIVKFTGMVIEPIGAIYMAGLEAEITFEDYVDNNSDMAGVVNLKIDAMNTAGITFSMITDGYLSITEGGNSYDWSCDQSITWSDGFITMDDATDDVFVLDGNSIQVKDTVTNETVIVKLKMTDCEYNPSGVLKITADKGGDQEFTVSIDFAVGSDYDVATEEGTMGQCDDWVLLNAEGIVENLLTQMGSF